MKVYIFGNEDLPQDNIAFKVAEKLNGKLENVQFVPVKPNEDLPFVDEEKIVIMDGVWGLDEVKLIEGNDIDRLVLPKRVTVHDFDLGFQLKYLKKLGKLGDVKIIGLPTDGKIDYRLIQSILRKLVAQDMQGS